MTEWTVNNKLNDWYRKQYHIKLPKNYETKSRLYFTASYSPFELFSTGSVGLWLDPSDVANLAWRRNLLTYSEQFDNAAWVKNVTTVTSNAATDPLGGATADLITASTAGAGPTYVGQLAVFTGEQVLSVYAKAGSHGIIQLINSGDAQAYANFNLNTGVIGTSGAKTTPQITSVGNGWYRCEARFSATASFANSYRVYFVPTQSSGYATAFTSTGTENFYLWGAQLELGTVATDYQRISDVNTEVIERFPTATMYQDAAGTTAVTTPGQPVGLRLDKSKGLALGAELVGGVWSGTGNAQDGTVFSGDDLEYWATEFATVIGRSYRFTATLSGKVNNSQIRFRAGISGTGTALYSSNNDALPLTVNILVVATSTTSNIEILFRSASASVTLSNISVRELAGNHATQSVLASRPVYGIEPAGGRRNLLTFSEDYSNAVWSKVGVTASGQRITANAATGTAYAEIAYANAPASAVTISAVFPSTAGRNRYVWIGDRGVVPLASATFDLNSVSVVGKDASVTAVAVTLPDGSVKCSITYTRASVGTSTPQFALAGATYTSDRPSLTWAGGEFLDAKMQFELGSTATPYQRVTSAFDVTEAGVQSCHYVQYDGSDDGMITNSIDFTATDKMSVFAGVRKLSDVAVAFVVELSVSAGGNAGAFSLTAPQSVNPTYGFNSRGSAALTGATYNNAAVAAPTVNVVSGSGDISGDSAILRVNGTQVAQSIVDQGTGTYGNYPLYLGRRANANSPFNGRDYGIVVVGKATTADEITATERWLSGKTGFYAPIITGVPTIGVS